MNVIHINHQPISKRNRHNDGSLYVHSIFPTIQGEGPFCGQPAVFVRLQGCNLQCPGCDTEYTEPRLPFTKINAASPEFVLRQVVRCSIGSSINLIVITGGEPFRQNITQLVELALKQGYRVQIETNGTLPPPATWPNNLDGSGITLVVSPKTGKVQPKTELRASAYKYVLHYGSIDSDGLPIQALGHSAAPRVARPPVGFSGPVYLQPMDCGDNDTNNENIRAVLNSCMTHGYTLQLQIHKHLGVE